MTSETSTKTSEIITARALRERALAARLDRQAARAREQAAAEERKRKAAEALRRERMAALRERMRQVLGVEDLEDDGFAPDGSFVIVDRVRFWLGRSSLGVQVLCGADLCAELSCMKGGTTVWLYELADAGVLYERVARWPWCSIHGPVESGPGAPQEDEDRAGEEPF